MRVVILQSNYIPWKGYFDLMNLADLFIVYDSVQYTKNDWRNRNQLVGPIGATWLTIPVNTAGLPDQTINEAEVSDSRWTRKHWMTIRQLLGKQPFFANYSEAWESWFRAASETSSLHEINLIFLRALASQLSINTPILCDTEFDYIKPNDSPTERLVRLCQAASADEYVTGPSGLNYLRLDQFRSAGIDVKQICYSGYPEYPQASASFTPYVSVLDLLANVGSEASSHLIGAVSPV